MVRVLTNFRGQRLALGAGFLAAATVTACGGKALDVGSDDTAVGGSMSSAGAAPVATPVETQKPRPPVVSLPGWKDPTWQDDQMCLPAPDSPLVGKWSGHWPQAPDNSDVVLEIKGLTSEGVPCGTLTVGEGAVPPPPTDAGSLFPPDAEAHGYTIDTMLPLGHIMNAAPWAGFPYRLLDVVVEEARLAFRFSNTELWRPWCQLQRPWPGSSSMWPASGFTGGTVPEKPGFCSLQDDNYYDEMPCSTFNQATVCHCTEAGCDSDTHWIEADVELHRDDAAWEGTVGPEKGGAIFLDSLTP